MAAAAATAAVHCHLATVQRVVGPSSKVSLARSTKASFAAVARQRGCSSVSTFGWRSRAVEFASRSGSRDSYVAVRSAVAEGAVASGESAVEEAAESLSMYFKAEGSLNDGGIPKVTKALEATEGVSNVKVYISEGAATVELTKQTNIQATGVASSLVQIIEQAGFKMQALSLGFDEDDDEDDEFIDYDPSTYVEEEEVVAA